MLGGAISWAFSLWVLPIGAPSPHGHGLILDAASELARTNGFMHVRKQWLVFTYMGAILLLLASRPAWIARLAPLGWAGRMALTNYMLQVAALDFLASGYGAGLRVRPLFSVIGTLLLFGGLAVFSRWWLARFRFGPAEWLWRCFTYLRVQPLRLARGSAAALGTT